MPIKIKGFGLTLYRRLLVIYTYMLSAAEQSVLDSIVVASENDPLRPEFPAESPKFPATPTYQIQVPGFSSVWLKDESHNPTGTHKDRMAWEIIVTYREFLLAKQRGQFDGPLPAMSIISAGSAAVAIQTQLKKYGLPNLKVLVDIYLDADIQAQLVALGCEVYPTDLVSRAFTWQDILHLTQNEHGFDITSNDALDPSLRFYDWLSYEIINQSPDYCFIPFGTGTLFENILNIKKREVTTTHHDPRFVQSSRVLRGTVRGAQRTRATHNRCYGNCPTATRTVRALWYSGACVVATNKKSSASRCKNSHCKYWQD
jgi:hypothetical protein